MNFLFGLNVQQEASNLIHDVDSKTIMMTSLGFIFVCFLINYAYKILQILFSPMRYKLDMTTKQYCKQLAEVNNNFRGFKSTINANTKANINGNEPSDNSTSEEDIKLVNGWIPIAESSKVGPGQVRKAIVFGKDLIVTRSEDGKQVNVLDAYCPHGGAHIGIGGFVKTIDDESCVQCPFHGWSFRSSDGQCIDIPYQKKKCIPSQAKLSSWTCCEVDNFIYLWHHLDNEKPNWSMKPSPELANWALAGRSCHVSNLELEYMHENGADLNHFAGIHDDLILIGGIENLPAYKYLQKYVKHSWEPSWRPITDEHGRNTHMAQLGLKSYLTIFGFNIFEFNVIATQIGPARVKLMWDSKWLGRGMLLMNSIPLGGRRVKYYQHVYSEPTFLGRLQAKIVLLGEIKMLERDQTIWNHKKYLKNPILVPEDKTIKQFRLWYSQFYKRKIKITSDYNDSSIMAKSKHISSPVTNKLILSTCY